MWLAPPLLLTAGLGISQPDDNDSFSLRPEPELFVDGRVGYPVDKNVSVGLRLRGSHTNIRWADSVAPRPYDQFNDTFELYTLDVGAFVELDSRYFNVMGWLGAHNARVHAIYNHYTDDNSATFREQEHFFTGPARAGGLALGVHIYTADNYRVTLFGEAAVSSNVFMTNKSLESDSYTYKPLSVGVAVRF
ncbi:MAG TPA: hypothetical protein VIV40_10895 [Kofleriaceae bacterium]